MACALPPNPVGFDAGCGSGRWARFFDGRPWWYRQLWRLSELLRHPISRAPRPIRYLCSQVAAATLYWPLSRLARLAERLGFSPDSFPLSFYRRRSFYLLRTDALDRFGARLDQRFTRVEIETMMHDAGLDDVIFSSRAPFWCAVGFARGPQLPGVISSIYGGFPMTALLLQTILTTLACAGLFLLWRRVSSYRRSVFWLVTLGLLGRAFGGVAAFFISYFHLPIARSLQMGNGIWLFAIDATDYVDRAAIAAHDGPFAIVHLSQYEPSMFYCQILATGFLLFGIVTSVAVLLNIAAYLGCCAIICWLGRQVNQRGAVVAVAVLSLAPSAVIWSLQPLKDIPFLFLLAAFIAVAYLWQQLWKAEAGTRRSIGAAVLCIAAMAALIYGISGIRWYFGFMLSAALVPFILLTIVNGSRRLAAAAAGIVLVVLTTAAFLSGAGPYVPASLRQTILGKSSRPQTAATLLISKIKETRAGFDHGAGTSIIGAGTAVSAIDKSIGAKETEVRAEPTYRGKATLLPVLPPPPQPQTGVIPAQTPAPPALPSRPKAEPVRIAAVPASLLTRLITGVAALVLPRFLAERLHLVSLGGGLGMWMVVEVDTLFFDTVLVFTAMSIVSAYRRRVLRSPVFWMVLMVTGTIGLVLIYSVSNFGTLFRHRDMILFGLLLLPLLTASTSSPTIVAEPAPVAGEQAEVGLV